ncbi:MAG: DUF5961 family protein [Caulobacterales bacterium]
MNNFAEKHFAARMRGPAAGGYHLVPGADSFIEAALLYAECANAAEDGIEVEVIDRETGVRRCFALDFATGDIASC